jgi:hypothetical protein
LKHLIFDLICVLEKYELWFERFLGGAFLQIGYGKVSYIGGEPYLRESIEIVYTLERVASPSVYLVDIFPILIYLPDWLAPFKEKGNLLYKRELEFYTSLLDDVRREVEQGTTLGLSLC